MKLPTVIAVGLLCAGLSSCRQPILNETSPGLVNDAHLRHLSESIRMGNDQVTIVHVYANYPDYKWVGAAESGPEGIACVDDAARAAVFYLRWYELTGDDASLDEARSLLRFVLAMQTQDGEFYNFIHEDHTINKDGKTSLKSFGWWAARGMWALCMGYHVFSTVDTGMALQLNTAIQRGLPHVRALLLRQGQTRELRGFRVPQWLLYESGADATSELVLGLCSYAESSADTSVRSMIRGLADGFMAMQDGNASAFPFGLHRSWETSWHMWGNGQTEALACAGKLLGDPGMVRSAEREALGFYSRLLINGFLKSLDVADPSKREEFEQIAYGVRPMAVGLVRLYEATGKIEYLKMAGLAASWLFGNNALQLSMYDPATGRCFDGIRDSVNVNKNSGAESTIEALITLAALESHPVATNYINYRKAEAGIEGDVLFALFRDSRGNLVRLSLDSALGNVTVKEMPSVDASDATIPE